MLLRKKYRPEACFDLKKLGELLRVGVSPFGIFFSPNLVLILINKAAEMNGGTVAVAAYTAVSYVTFIAMRLIQGVGDGAQPLLSFYEGNGDARSKHAVLRYGLYATGLITVAVTLVCVFARVPLSGLFGLSAEGRAIFADALFIMILPLIAFGFMRISMSYFYAQKRNLFANIITYGEPIIVAAVVFTLPAASGLTGIWLSAPGFAGQPRAVGARFSALPLKEGAGRLPRGKDRTARGGKRK